MSGATDNLRALALPWLRPTDAALLALTADPPDVAVARDDPGLVLHLLRHGRPGMAICFAELLSQPAVCATAAVYLGRETVRRPLPDDVVRFGRVAARLASDLAESSQFASPDLAWAAGLLSPLGWYAGATHEPVVVGRQLAVRWRLPYPLALTIGFPALEPNDLARLGGDAELHRIFRAAVAEAERRLGSLRIVPNPDSEQTFPAVEFDGLADMQHHARPADPELLVRLLTATAAARQRSATAVVAELERRLDRMADLLADARGEFAVAVRDAKLTAMAEFAAGASHEINNPLAIASGNAQRLLAGETDPDRRRRLEAIVRASGRVHDILVGTRQFARPPAPKPVAVSLHELLAPVVASVQAATGDRGVSLETCVPSGVVVLADPGQARQAIGNLLQNAVEAAPAGGWVRVLAECADGHVRLVVEDSGVGPAADQVPHLFDPFFCGRAAGRGRGLGLSIAWRLARQNGGDVRYDPTTGGPTRFVLTLPGERSNAERKIA